MFGWNRRYRFFQTTNATEYHGPLWKMQSQEKTHLWNPTFQPRNWFWITQPPTSRPLRNSEVVTHISDSLCHLAGTWTSGKLDNIYGSSWGYAWTLQYQISWSGKWCETIFFYLETPEVFNTAKWSQQTYQNCIIQSFNANLRYTIYHQHKIHLYVLYDMKLEVLRKATARPPHLRRRAC